MNSIRQRLLFSLLLGLVVISSITGVFIYRHVRVELDELYNAHLQQIANIIARESGRLNFATQLFNASRSSTKTAWEEEDYLIQIWQKDGSLLSQENPAKTNVAIPLYPSAGLHRKRIDNESWRIYRADGEKFIVQIAQPEYARRSTIRDTSLQLLIPLVLQIPLLIGVAWMSVRHGLRPLQSLSNAIAQRQPEALHTIDTTNQPDELRSLVDTLNALLKRLEVALQQQRNFVADAAHELRTPVAALQLQLELMQRADLPADREQAIAQLRSGLQRITHLTQQLLSIARAESHETVAQALVSLPTVIEAVMERHLPLARARNQDLGVTQLESLAIECVRSDIETVFDNLLSNAIRYTPVGGRIDLAVYADQDCAIFQVTDTGPGITEAERARIFDRFYRVLDNHATNIISEGSGLGLAIVKAICERYGATIQVDAGENHQGACFSVRWPL